MKILALFGLFEFVAVAIAAHFVKVNETSMEPIRIGQQNDSHSAIEAE